MSNEATKRVFIDFDIKVTIRFSSLDFFTALRLSFIFCFDLSFFIGLL